MSLKCPEGFSNTKLAFIELAFPVNNIKGYSSRPVSDQVTYLNAMYAMAKEQLPTCYTLDYEKDEISGEKLIKVNLSALYQDTLPNALVDRLLQKPRYTNYTMERTVNWYYGIVGHVVDKREPGPTSAELLYHLKLDQVEDWCCLWFSEDFLDS